MRFLSRNSPVKIILCYGDSNTWGTIPGGGKFPWHERWVGILQNRLGGRWRVIDDGLCGRTAGCDDHTEPGVERNGLKLFKTSLLCRSPLDICIIMLGTNDFKTPFHRPGADVAEDLKSMVLQARQDYGYGIPPRVLLICPPALTEAALVHGDFADGPSKSRDLRDMLRRCGGGGINFDRETTLLFADDILTQQITSADGIHLSREGNRLLGNAVAEELLHRR